MRWMDMGWDISPAPRIIGPLGGLALLAPTEIKVTAHGDLCPHYGGDIIPGQCDITSGIQVHCAQRLCLAHQ